jgi:hypothetical protein
MVTTKFSDTFANAASAKSINIILSIDANSLNISSIKTAFLYFPLKDDLYLK